MSLGALSRPAAAVMTRSRRLPWRRLALLGGCLGGVAGAEIALPHHASAGGLGVLPVLVTAAWLGGPECLLVMLAAAGGRALELADGSLDALTAGADVVGYVAAALTVRLALRRYALGATADAAPAPPAASPPVAAAPIGDWRVPARPRAVGADGPRVDHAVGFGPLTRREREVVDLAMQGLTAREIAARLVVGERTVETHLANAYPKLGVCGKRDLGRLRDAAP